MNRILFEPAEIAGDLATFGGAADGAQSVAGRLLLAIGPEGGWTDEEVALLEAHGFARHSLGPRILRTDTAAVALLAQLMPRDGSCASGAFGLG